MKKKVFAVLLTSVVGLILLHYVFPTQVLGESKVYKLRLQSILSPGFTEWDVLLPRFVDRVKIMSQGRIQIELYPSGALVPALQEFKAVGKGAIDMAHNSPAYWMGVEPAAYVAWFGPPEFKMVDQYEYLWWEQGLLELMRKVVAKHNVYMIAPVWSDEWGRIASTKPINSLKDVKGMKIRTWGVFGQILEEHGASIVSMPGQEIYTALSRKTIDAANWGSPALNNSIKLQEVAKFYIGPTLIWNDVESFDINLDKWRDLPVDLKEILTAAARQFAIERTSYSIYESAKISKEWEEKYGVKFTYLPDQEKEYVEKRAMELLGEKAKQNEYAAEAFRIIAEAQKAYGGMKWMVP